jgi:glucose/arabinose dehydrogenase
MKYNFLLTLLAQAALSAPVAAYTLTPAFPNIVVERPITLVIPNDGTDRLFLAQQRGQVRILPKDESGAEAQVFLDLSSRKMEATEQSKFEEGLNGMAFHPKYAQNGKFYLYYTQQEPKRAVLSEMQVSKTDPNRADPATERVLLEIPLPYWNHHSGNIAFGPDGFLYIAIGDGGGKDGDPLRWAQNPFVLQSKVLRIDVDTTSGARAYGIPQDNPFLGKDGHRPEVYASGFRNPWGMSFDAEGSLWLADVGQELWEEINLVEKGANYGWSFRDGNVKYWRRTDEPLVETKFTDPVFQYDHAQGISITGGFVYQGERVASLKNRYVYGDWGLGRIWALQYDKAAGKTVSNELVYQSDLDPKGKGIVKPAAFCPDAKGEVLVLDWNGKLFRIGE